MAEQLVQALQKYIDRVPKSIVYFFAALGAFSVAQKLSHPLADFYRYFLQGIPDYAGLYGKGTYVFITGASDGIGEQLAYEFAKRGFNLVLLGRNEQKINKVKEKCVLTFSARVVSIIEDLATTDLQVYDRISDRVRNLDISILVNNAGINSYGAFAGLSATPEKNEIGHLISLNCFSHTMIIRKLLPQLLARPRKSLIINMASMTGIMPVGYMALYSASKAYIRYFSLALAEEVKQKIHVFIANPSRINTKMPGYPGVSSEVTALDVTVQGILSQAPRQRESFCSFKHAWMHYKSSFFSLQTVVKIASARLKANYEKLNEAKQKFS